MPITLQLPAVLARLADGNRSIEVEASTVGEVVAQAASRFPALGPRLADERGEPYPFVTYYLNDADIRFASGFNTAVTEGDELVVVPAIAGG
jgi:molybdopterin converting factor small subunit